MFKNLSPSEISLYCSIILSSIFLISFLVLHYFGLLGADLRIILFLLPLSLIVSYAVFLFFINIFIYRRIKLIYKNIHSIKVESHKKKTVYNSNSVNLIEDVEKEVVHWAEDQKKEIDQLKEMEEYRRRFLGDISHELKTPIFNIQGYIHTLIDGGLYDEKINKRYLERAAKNIERLLEITEDLNEISKLEAGILVMEKQDFNIKELAQEVFDELEFMAKEKAIAFSFKDGADKGFMVNADREAIRQILVNLISNSIKYGKSGGRTKVSFYDMDRFVLVEVADNGIGIEEKHLKYLFDRFYRVEKSRSRDFAGSGLGLAIVKHLIEAHNETINVRSSIERGSTFGFTLAKGNL